VHYLLARVDSFTTERSFENVDERTFVFYITVRGESRREQRRFPGPVEHGSEADRTVETAVGGA